MDEHNDLGFAYGSLLGRATLKHLIDRGNLVLWCQDKALTYDDLLSTDQIDETSISLHIGELYRHAPELHALDIQGKYDLESDYEPVLPDEQGGVIVEPNQFILGKTLERLTTPQNVVGFIEERRTTAGSLGLLIRGFVPPGLVSEKVRFTLYSSGSCPLRIYIGKVPPMKVVFESLSSAEVYGKDRETRVVEEQVYSGGAGDPRFSRLGAVLASFSSNHQVAVRQSLTVNFRLENVGAVPVKTTRIYPLLSTDVFRIVSCSPGWVLEKHELVGSPNGLLAPRRQVGAYALSCQTPFDPNEVIHGTFDVQFLKALTLPQFKIAAECFLEDGTRTPVKHPTDYNPLTVMEKRPVIPKELKDYLVPALLAAIIYGLLSRFGPGIVDFLKNLLDIFFDMIG